ncbi:MAG TPA: glycosyltransferase family 2 protein [Thermoanaerobaculia bacterium]|nr:glycosyltransferase family 2 protein [Thermoanaerobaculia bacterium]
MSEIAVSVIVPAYDRAGMIAESIDSALRAAPDLSVEVVVVDDASTDGTAAAVLAYGDPRVQLVRLDRNGGQSAARNHGLDAARGKYVKFLDSDDVLLPGHLAAEVRALDEGADIAVSGWCDRFADGRTVCWEPPVFASIADDVLAGRAVPTSSALYRRRKEWRWDPGLRKLDDWDYFCQAALGAQRIATVPGYAYEMRHHAGARATDATMLLNAREHHHILRKIEERLAREERLTPARRRRLAQYYYKELRVLCFHDPAAFEVALRHIQALDPSFAPRDEERQRFMRVLARLVGVRTALRLHTSIKRLAWALRGRRA